jgi:hypothetical protein
MQPPPERHPVRLSVRQRAELPALRNPSAQQTQNRPLAEFGFPGVAAGSLAQVPQLLS